MKEYEYINCGIENFLVDELVGVICQENLRCIPYPDGFRRIFDNYIKLRQKYRNEIANMGVSELPESVHGKIMDDFAEDRGQFLEAFLIDLEQNYPDLNARQLSKDYLEQARSENILTTARRVCIYPHLIFQAMQSDERE